MSTTYRPAVTAKKIGDELIGKHHPDLVTAGVHIEYVFRSDTAKSKGKDVWGKARKVSGLNAYLAGDAAEGDEVEDFFVIELSEPVWGDLNDAGRRALVDHELSHCRIVWDDEGEMDGIAIASHDVEEFAAVIERHGLWRPDVEHFVQRAAGQLSLLDQ